MRLLGSRKKIHNIWLLCREYHCPLDYKDNYEILSLEIYNYKLVVVLSLAQHTSKTTVEPKRGRLRVCSSSLQTEKYRSFYWRTIPLIASTTSLCTRTGHSKVYSHEASQNVFPFQNHPQSHLKRMYHLFICVATFRHDRPCNHNSSRANYSGSYKDTNINFINDTTVTHTKQETILTKTFLSTLCSWFFLMLIDWKVSQS